MTNHFSEIFHTVTTTENVTSCFVAHARTHPHTKKFKNETHLNMIPLWPFMNVSGMRALVRLFPLFQRTSDIAEVV